MQIEPHPVFKIFAHRGANRLAPENTRAAFDKAFEYAIDGVETDVQLSKDGVPVLWHDSYLDKLGLYGQRIEDFDFQQLQDPGFPRLEGTGTLMGLEEFLLRYRGQGILNVEVKFHEWESPGRQQDKLRLTLDLIGEAGVDDVFVSAFNLQCLVFAHRHSPRVSLFYLLSDRQTAADVTQALMQQPFLTGFCLPIRLIDQELVALLRDNDKHIVVYTCNTEAEILKAINLNVDILITDDPPQAFRLRS